MSDTVNFKGKRVLIKGEMPAVGMGAPDFTFVTKDLAEKSIYDYDGQIKVIIAVPSLDTGICAIETRKFNKHLAGKDGLVGFVISKDLPFAMSRFCEAEGIENVHIASDYRYNDFCDEYGTEMLDGPLKGLSSRAIFVIGKDDKIAYAQLVPEITEEPNYDEAMEAINGLL